MREAVSDILVERAQITDGMSRMLLVSLVAHAALAAALVFAPGFWTGLRETPAQPMMITLGGAEGPDAGGITTISARPVQRVAEPDEKPSRPAPPADKPPEMVAPKPEPKPAPRTPPKPVDKPKEASTSKTPAAGAEIKTGSAKAETGGAAVPFGGLTTGGGGAGGARVEVPNFCCQAYLESVVGMIKRNWDPRQSIRGKNTIKFVIQRDGTITNVHVDESGGQLLDLASQRALLYTKRVQPLPAEFTPPTLTVYLVFDYSRR
jgi:outer membrane biosynthesis protein TonB